jgi:iron complex outermembrane receptor protein
VEKGTTLELGMKFKTPTIRANFGAFITEFNNFIGLIQDGEFDETGNGDMVPKYNFTGIKARMYGLEADGRLPIARGVFGKASEFNMDWKADYVRGENRSTGGSLPRISPLRLSSALVYSQGMYSSQLDVQYAARQNRYADDLGSTPSYTILSLGASYKTPMPGFRSALIFMRVENLTNVEARNASSVLRDMAPAGARAIKVGLKGNF